MGTFSKEFKSSLTSGRWYHDLSTGKHHLSFRYPAVISIISTLMLTLGFSIALYSVFIPQARYFVASGYPADLVVTMSHGELSTNQFGPYVIPAPPNSKVTGQTNSQTKTNLVVINPGAEATLDATTKYDTYMFANKTTLIATNEDGKIEAIPLKDFPDFVLNRENIVNLFDQVAGFAWLFPIIFFLFIGLFVFVVYIIMAVFSGALLWLILKASSRRIRYANAFQVSLYAYTFTLVIDLLSVVFGFNPLGFWTSIIVTNAVACLFIFNTKETATSTTTRSQI